MYSTRYRIQVSQSSLFTELLVGVRSSTTCPARSKWAGRTACGATCTAR